MSSLQSCSTHSVRTFVSGWAAFISELEFCAKSTGLFPLARRDLELKETSVSHVKRTSLYPLRPDLHSRSFLPSFLNWSDPSLGLSANWFSVLTQCLPVHLSGGVWLSRINSLLHPFLSLFLITFYIHSSVYLNVHLQKLSLYSPASILILIQTDVKYMKKIFYSTLFTVGWKVSKLSSFYFPLKFHLQNNFSVEKKGPLTGHHTDASKLFPSF